jgi:hypothetical protein
VTTNQSSGGPTLPPTAQPPSLSEDGEEDLVHPSPHAWRGVSIWVRMSNAYVAEMNGGTKLIPESSNFRYSPNTVSVRFSYALTISMAWDTATMTKSKMTNAMIPMMSLRIYN